jgi:orotidine-5'-phosphate decarboxylase
MDKIPNSFVLRGYSPLRFSHPIQRYYGLAYLFSGETAVSKNFLLLYSIRTAMKQDTRIILALDETDKRKAVAVADTVCDFVDAIKVNYPIVLACGLGIVEELATYTDIICDFKLADIPNTNKLIVERAIQAGAEGVIVHGFVGRDSLQACVDAASGKDVFVVVEMSHPGSLEFIQPYTDRLAALAVNCGATGVIAPATRPERVAHIRTIVGKKLKILSPGVGVQGGSASAAIRAGADYIIVGRSIYKATEPRKVAMELVEEIKQAINTMRNR